MSKPNGKSREEAVQHAESLISIILPIALRLASLDADGLSTDPTLRQVSFAVWTQVEIHYSLVSATILCLRPVITNLATNYGALGPESKRLYGSGPGSAAATGSTLRMSRLERSINRTNVSEQDNAIELASKVTPRHDLGYTVEACHGANPARMRSDNGAMKAETGSLASNDSKQMIIKKYTSWTVAHENAT
jgi:hypothetical protein